jgi:hypothetical protein
VSVGIDEVGLLQAHLKRLGEWDSFSFLLAALDSAAAEWSVAADVIAIDDGSRSQRDLGVQRSHVRSFACGLRGRRDRACIDLGRCFGSLQGSTQRIADRESLTLDPSYPNLSC